MISRHSQVPERWRQPLRIPSAPAADTPLPAAPAAGQDGGEADGEADGSFAGMLATLLAGHAAAADAKDMSALLASNCLGHFNIFEVRIVDGTLLVCTYAHARLLLLAYKGPPSNM